MTQLEEEADISQSFYILLTLNGVLKAIHEDGIKVAVALVWAMVNNWEWGEYDDHYGLQYFNSTTPMTSYKRGIFDLADFINGNLVGI